MANQRMSVNEMDGTDEALANFFPRLSETGHVPPDDGDELEGGTTTSSRRGALDPDDEVPVKEAYGAIPTLGEDLDEEVEISEEALREVYESAHLAEVQVKKGFSDMTAAGELADVVKNVGKGLNPEKKGEGAWEDGTPVVRQDYSVKEAIMRGMQENKQLREHLAKAVRLIKTLGGKLHEVNLFNSKVLHVNKIMNQRNRLSTEQKRVVLESLDKARSIDEVKMVYEAIVSSFNASQALSEGNTRKPVANAQRARTSGTPKHEVLSESVDRANGDRFSRLRMLAGLTR